MTNLAKLILVVGLLASTPACADKAASEVEAMMREYAKLFSAGDIESLSGRIYRFDVPTPLSTREGLSQFFRDLKAQGYDHSVTHDLSACLLSEGTALAWQRYSRIKTDGSVMPPEMRQSIYVVKHASDGWHISEILQTDPTAKLNCTSLKP
jgi:hypothetical protein